MMMAPEPQSRRPDKRRSDWHEVFLNVIAAGASIEEAADRAGVNASTIYRHRNADQEFAAAFDAARGKPASARADQRLRQADNCGTPAGYSRHLYHREKPCEPCRDANNQYHRDRPKSRAYARAKSRARTRLVAAHKDEHKDLNQQERRREDHSLDGAWVRAANTLTRRYPEEYRALLAQERAAAEDDHLDDASTPVPHPPAHG